MIGLEDAIKEAKESGRRVYLIGNGGSHANASHIANDLATQGVRAHVLDPATLTAWANDLGWYNVYARWLCTYADAEDILIAMSGSGKSPNILMAIEEAERLGMKVWRIFGSERGEGMQSAEESQIKIGHDLMRALCG